MDVIRLVLQQVESGEKPPGLNAYEEDFIVYNIALMNDAGLIDAVIVKDPHGIARRAKIMRLTWAGHDFLDSVRDETIWQKAKDKVMRPAGSWTFGLLVEVLKQEIKNHIPGL